MDKYSIFMFNLFIIFVEVIGFGDIFHGQDSPKIGNLLKSN